MSPPCPDPEAAHRHVQMPPRWTELKKLIDELMEAKSVSLGFQTSTSRSPDGRRHFRFDGLVYDRLLSSGVRPKVMVFNFEYGRGSLEATQPTPGFDRAEKAGIFEASYLEAVHHVRKGPMKPQSLLNIQRGQSSAEFRKVQDEVFKVYRLFSEVMPAIDPAFAPRFSAVVASIKREIDTHWVHHPTVRSDVWSTPVGSLVQKPGLSATATFEMTKDKRNKLRELTGAGSIDLPVLLFEIGQPKDPDQRTGVLSDERPLAQLVSRLQEVERRSGSLGFVVYGYADGSGRTDLNLELAANRAEWTIRRVREHGVRLDLTAMGCGDHHARARTGTRRNPKQRAVLLAAD